MKSCISVLLIIILIPIFFSALLLTSINNVFLDESNYRKILSDPLLKKDEINFVTLSIRDNIISKSEDAKSLLDNESGESALNKFVSNLNGSTSFADESVAMVKYINGKEPILNLNIKLPITELQFNTFKQDVISSVSDGILSLKKCDTNQTTPDTNCRLASLSSQDVIDKVRETTDKALIFTDFQNALVGKLPISIDTKNHIEQAKSSYDTFKTIISSFWVASFVIIFFIIVINVYPKITFFSYLGTASFISVFLMVALALISALLWKRNSYVSSGQLGLSSDFNIDTSNTAVDLINNLISQLFNIAFINFVILGGILLIISIVMWLIDFLLKKHYDNKLFERQYSINAFSKKEDKLNQ